MFEIQLSPSSITDMPYFTMILMGMSMVLFFKYLLAVARDKYALKARGEHFCMQLVTLLVSFQILLWQLCYYSDSHDTMAFWCIGIAVACGIAFWRGLHLPLKSILPTSRTIQILLGLVSLLQVAGFVHTTRRFTEPVNNLLFASPAPGELVTNDKFRAATDQGNPVGLFTRDVADEKFRLHVVASRAALIQLAGQSIECAEPQSFTNCHGWVFTEGKHLIRGVDVQMILNENGYRDVDVPRPDDVIVYRDQTGAVIHTGVVRSTLANGTILIESKWGFASTYLHFATNQPYSQNYSFYRSDRSGHAIHMEPATNPSPSGASVVSQGVAAARRLGS